MFAFPWSDMVGGIFYEHSHRMLATIVGAMTLGLAIWLGLIEKRNNVKKLGYIALIFVIIQGLLGGLTVMFFLPTAISMIHGITAQTFLLVIILIAFALSREYSNENSQLDSNRSIVLILFVAVYIQLILGAWMRHTESGLAIYDFPKMAGQWLPIFNDKMLTAINDWRFDMDYPEVAMQQVVIHFLHRLGAFVIFILTIVMGYRLHQQKSTYSKMIQLNVFAIYVFVALQILLGVLTIWTAKGPFITSFHVMNGATVMGLCFILFLRLSDLAFLQK
jgi:cytochrome c oxidase assembly protein subunit 15